MFDKLNNPSPSPPGRDEKRKKRALLLKLAAMLTLSAVIVIFGSLYMITT